MARKNPEAPREGVDETRRDLDNLRSEVKEGENHSVESLESDEEVKSGMKKILDKGSEGITTEFEKELPENFNIAEYASLISESHSDLGFYVLSLTSVALPGTLRDPRVVSLKFKDLPIENKIAFMSFKKAVDKLTSEKNLSEVSSEKILKEAEKQKALFVKKMDESLVGKDLRSFGLTNSEYNKLYELLNNKGFIKKIVQDGSSDNSDEGSLLYGKNGAIFGSESEGEPHYGRMAETKDFGITLLCIVIAGVGGYCLGRCSGREESTTNTKKEHYGPVEFDHAEDILGLMTHRVHAQTPITHAEKRWPGDHWYEDLGNNFGKDRVSMKVSGDVISSFEGVENAKINIKDGVLKVNVDRPTVFARNVEGFVLGKGGSWIKLFPSQNIQMHGLKLGEYNMLMETIGYEYNNDTQQWVLNPVKAAKYESEVKESLKKGLKGLYRQFDVTRVEVNFTPGSKTKVEVESDHRDETKVPDWMKNWTRPWKTDSHYVQ